MQCTEIFFLLLKLKMSLDFFLYIFLIFAQNIDCGYTLELPCRGGSNEYPQSICFGAKIRKIGIPMDAYPSFTI